MGEVGSVLGMGITSAQVFAALQIPYTYLRQIGLPFNQWNLEMHTKLTIGFSGLTSQPSLSKKGEATVSLLPILFNLEIGYALKEIRGLGKLRPFASAGFGVSSTSMEFTPKSKNYSVEATKDASNDAALAFGLGIALVPSFTQKMEILLDAKYLNTMELVSGNYLLLSLGAAYCF